MPPLDRHSGGGNSAPAVSVNVPSIVTRPSSLPPLETGMLVQSPEKVSLSGGSGFEDSKAEVMKFKKIFQENIKNKPVRHDHVHVLLLSWEDAIDDLKVKNEVNELQALFDTGYGFHVTNRCLDYQGKPEDQLQYYLAEFKFKYNNPYTLLIIYYAGHGLSGTKGKNDGLLLTAQTGQQTEAEKERNYIAWSKAEAILSGTIADVLVIFDCCEAGSFNSNDVRSSKPTFQFLAACRKGERTPKPGPTSFTSALMWALTELRATEKPFNSTNLFKKIKQYPRLPKTQTPELRIRFGTDLWIEPLNGEKGRPESASGEKRDPRHEYLDLRFDFYRKVREEDVKNTARVLSRLINENSSSDFGARSIALMGKSSVQERAVELFKAGLHRKRSSTGPGLSPLPQSLEQTLSISPVADDLVTPADESPESHLPYKRPKVEQEPIISTQKPGALYHFRMFLDCTLQNARARIGRLADRVRPTARERVETRVVLGKAVE